MNWEELYTMWISAGPVLLYGPIQDGGCKIQMIDANQNGKMQTKKKQDQKGETSILGHKGVYLRQLATTFSKILKLIWE